MKKIFAAVLFAVLVMFTAGAGQSQAMNVAHFVDGTVADDGSLITQVAAEAFFSINAFMPGYEEGYKLFVYVAAADPNGGDLGTYVILPRDNSNSINYSYAPLVSGITTPFKTVRITQAQRQSFNSSFSEPVVLLTGGEVAGLPDLTATMYCVLQPEDTTHALPAAPESVVLSIRFTITAGRISGIWNTSGIRVYP